MPHLLPPERVARGRGSDNQAAEAPDAYGYAGLHAGVDLHADLRMDTTR